MWDCTCLRGTVAKTQCRLFKHHLSVRPSFHPLPQQHQWMSRKVWQSSLCRQSEVFYQGHWNQCESVCIGVGACSKKQLCSAAREAWGREEEALGDAAWPKNCSLHLAEEGCASDTNQNWCGNPDRAPMEECGCASHRLQGVLQHLTVSRGQSWGGCAQHKQGDDQLVWVAQPQN